MSDELLTRRDHGKDFAKPTTVDNVFRLQPFKGFVIEVEDVHFHFDSAVFLADYGDFAKDVDVDDERVVGLCAVKACYLQAKANPQQKLLLAGHTDTSGTNAYNFGLSRKRAGNFLAVLTGDRDSFVQIALGQHKVEDYQQILKWVAYLWDWPCDPGPVDNTPGTQTTDGTKAFQKQYNIEYEKSIAESGTVDEDTWGAFFDVYMCVLEDLLNTDDAGLQGLRAGLNFLDPKTVGCGEEFPIDSPRKQEYRSKTNRRIECLFYDPPQVPQLNCHPSVETCTPLLCEIYNPKMYTYTHIPVPPTKYHREFKIKLEYGDIDSLFTDIAVKTHTDAGVRERMQALGFLYEPLNSANIAQRAQDAFEHFKTKVLKVGTDADAVDQLAPLLRSTVVDQNKLPAPGSFSKIRLPGTYCIKDYLMSSTPASLAPDSHRFHEEKDVWNNNPNLGLIPLIATVQMRRACQFHPAGAGIKVHFQLLKPDDIPAGSNVAAPPLRSVAFVSHTTNKTPPPPQFTYNMTGSPQQYVTNEKNNNPVVADDPQVDNAHQSVGGKRGNPVGGNAKLTNVLETGTVHAGFQTKFNLQTAADSTHTNAVVAETNDDGKAGVILMPAFTGGDRYKIRAFVDPLGSKASDGTEDDAAKDDTGTMVVWRILRFSKYLQWDYPAGVSAADKANAGGPLPTFDITGLIASEYKKSWFDVTVEDDAKAPVKISQAVWQAAMQSAKATAIVNVGAAMNRLYDIATLVPDTNAGGFNNPSAGLFNFLTAAQYDAAAKGHAPPGGWPSAVSDPAYWNNMKTIFYAIMEEFILFFTKNAIGGITVIQAPVEVSLTLNPGGMPGAPSDFFASGFGMKKRGCYVIYGQTVYASFPYSADRNAMHETGHCLFGVHQYTLTAEVNVSTGGLFDQHDYHDLCVLGYMNCAGDFCGRCVLNQAGWNMEAMAENHPGP